VTGLSLRNRGLETDDELRGAFGLNLLYTPTEPIVDLIFVHGKSCPVYLVLLSKLSERRWVLEILCDSSVGVSLNVSLAPEIWNTIPELAT